MVLRQVTPSHLTPSSASVDVPVEKPGPSQPPTVCPSQKVPQVKTEQQPALRRLSPLTPVQSPPPRAPQAVQRPPPKAPQAVQSPPPKAPAPACQPVKVEASGLKGEEVGRQAVKKARSEILTARKASPSVKPDPSPYIPVRSATHGSGGVRSNPYASPVLPPKSEDSKKEQARPVITPTRAQRVVAPVPPHEPAHTPERKQHHFDSGFRPPPKPSVTPPPPQQAPAVAHTASTAESEAPAKAASVPPSIPARVPPPDRAVPVPKAGGTAVPPKAPPAPPLAKATPPTPVTQAAATGAGGDTAFTVAQAGQRVIVPADKHEREKKYKVFKRQVTGEVEASVPAEVVEAWKKAVTSNSKAGKTALFQTWCQAGGNWSLKLGFGRALKVTLQDHRVPDADENRAREGHEQEGFPGYLK